MFPVKKKKEEMEKNTCSLACSRRNKIIHVKTYHWAWEYLINVIVCHALNTQQGTEKRSGLLRIESIIIIVYFIVEGQVRTLRRFRVKYLCEQLLELFPHPPGPHLITSMAFSSPIYTTWFFLPDCSLINAVNQRTLAPGQDKEFLSSRN